MTTLLEPQPAKIIGREPRSSRLPATRGVPLAYALSGVTAVLLLLTSIAGVVFGQRGLYVPDSATMPAFLGQDALSLIFGLPLLLGAATLARRGSLGGLLVWMGALFYIAYSYAFYPLSPEFNALYLAYIAVVSTSLYSLVYLLMSVNAEAVQARFSPRTPVRLIGGFMMLMALLLTLKWVSTIVGMLADGAIPTRVQLVVWPLDLIVAHTAASSDTLSGMRAMLASASLTWKYSANTPSLVFENFRADCQFLPPPRSDTGCAL